VVRRITAVILALAALMGVTAVFSSAAFADGDPASDVLAYDPIYFPTDSGISATDRAVLLALVKAVKLPVRKGSSVHYPLKVAFVNSAADLGSITSLWQEPASYGVFLGKELSLEFHGTVLVVMPQGYGLYVNVPLKDIPPGDLKAVDDLNAPGSQLAAGANLVIRRLAADNGIPLPKRLAVAATTASSGSSSATPLIGFAIGLIAIAGAWAASLRMRPLRPRVAA
jgi:hypothetical protein